MAIWLHAREEFADNRLQLLFINIDIQKGKSSQTKTRYSVPCIWYVRLSQC